MYSTLFSLLLATSSMSNGYQSGFQSGYQDDGYGSYGGYGLPGGFGSYGSYGTTYGGGRQNWGVFGPQGQGPSMYVNVTNPCDKRFTKLEERMTELEKSNQFLVQKIKDLEKKVEEDNNTVKQAENQAKILEQIDRKFVLFQKEMTETIKVQTPNDDLKSQLAQIQSTLKSFQDQANANQAAVNQAATQKVDILVELLKVKLNWGEAEWTKEWTKALQGINQGLRELKLPTDPPKTQLIGTDLSITKTNRGMIIVNLPADATLYVNEQVSNPGANVRTFISPDLEPGKTYFYTIRCDLKRNDRIVTETQKIYFHPGSEVPVNFNHLDRAEPVSQIKSKTN